MNDLTQKNINDAAEIVGKTWPLYGFVTSNPLIGLENKSFENAVTESSRLLNASVFPKPAVYQQALNVGEIDKEILSKMLNEQGFSSDLKRSLTEMGSTSQKKQQNKTHQVDRILVKWLSAFLDEGLADWEMPQKSQGFYKSWRLLATHDAELGNPSLKGIPETSSKALTELLKDYSIDQQASIFKYNFAALPGWVGYIKHRVENNTLWHQQFPLYLEDYLAVRLTIAKLLNKAILPSNDLLNDVRETTKLQHIWLEAWEKSFQNDLSATLTAAKQKYVDASSDKKQPDAQLVFCIDTRSELIRRHVEIVGNYETFGYAGFFGIAMDYKSPSDGLVRKSCPPIVGSAYEVTEQPKPNATEQMNHYLEKEEEKRFGEYFLKRMKNMLPSAFGFVEGSGAFYGLSLFGRTIFPGVSFGWKRKKDTSYEGFSNPKANCQSDHEMEIPLEQKIGIVKSAIDLMCFTEFAPFVVLVGHGSNSANNPFGSSLDCGACAANPGKHNARLFANLANQIEVREGLKTSFGIEIPDSTTFIGAQHNTTTEEIVLFDGHIAENQQGRLQKLKQDLIDSQRTAASERSANGLANVNSTHKKANNWAETRPEWGLAKNGGFIIAPRLLTKNVDLNSRCFLHSYDWKQDLEGKALESIMQGPMVVTQWINNHYYFATVDNDKFGGGSKITHNVTGKFGVVQGNGGDLKTGLPLQSIMETDEKMFHQPLRLSVIIQAPVATIEKILDRNANLKALLDNQWIYLMVMDPKQEDSIVTYKKGMIWEPTDGIAKTQESLSEELLIRPN